jgi:predicted nucleic acid-binding protein
VILVDTNILVAAARTADTNHRPAAQLLQNADDALLVTPGVIAETCYLLHDHGGPRPEVEFLRSIATGGLELAELTVPDVARMAELCERYADLGLGGTDASVIAVAERLNISTVATFDRRHFTVVRPAHVEALELLPA